MITLSKAPFIELKNVGKNFYLNSGAELKVLEDVNLAIEPDTVVALLGPSGSGKTTCLRTMCGLLESSEGQVLSRGEKLEGTNQDVAMVFQSFALFPWETVHENIAMAISGEGLTKQELRARVKNAVDLVGLEGFEEAYPRELSGGMKQRVGIARALAMQRPVLFLDEPFSSLDVLTADALRAEMIELWQAKTTNVRTMVLVSHNIEEAVYLAEKIFVMGTNPGHIRKEIVNDLPYPRDDQTPEFRRMVAHVYEQITETLMPDEPDGYQAPTVASKESRKPAEPAIEPIPAVQIGAMIGLLEAVSDAGGLADIFQLSKETGKDFGTTLYLAKAAELLDLVETPKHSILLTDLGNRFVDGDINARKRILHELFGGLSIVQLTTNLLKSEEDLRIPLATLTERVVEWLPNENPDELVETLISWGRFAEFFGYNDDTKQIYLDVGQETT